MMRALTLRPSSVTACSRKPMPSRIRPRSNSRWARVSAVPGSRTSMIGIAAMTPIASLRRGTHLERVGPSLAGPDADHLVDRRDEDLSVADAARACAGDDGLHRLRHALVGDEHGDLHLGEEVDHVLRATVQLGVAPLASEALHLVHRHPLRPDLRQAVLDLIDLERLHDRIDPLHVRPRSKTATIAAPRAGVLSPLLDPSHAQRRGSDAQRMGASRRAIARERAGSLTRVTVSG